MPAPTLVGPARNIGGIPPKQPNLASTIGKNPTIIGENPNAAFPLQKLTLLHPGTAFIPEEPLGAIGTGGGTRTEDDGAGPHPASNRWGMS